MFWYYLAATPFVVSFLLWVWLYIMVYRRSRPRNYQWKIE